MGNEKIESIDYEHMNRIDPQAKTRKRANRVIDPQFPNTVIQ